MLPRPLASLVAHEAARYPVPPNLIQHGQGQAQLGQKVLDKLNRALDGYDVQQVLFVPPGTIPSSQVAEGLVRATPDWPAVLHEMAHVTLRPGSERLSRVLARLGHAPAARKGRRLLELAANQRVQRCLPRVLRLLGPDAHVPTAREYAHWAKKQQALYGRKLES